MHGPHSSGIGYALLTLFCVPPICVAMAVAITPPDQVRAPLVVTSSKHGEMLLLFTAQA